MDAVRAYEAQLPVNALMFNFLDNHDTANDGGELCADGYCRLGRHGFFVCEVRDS